LRRSSINAEANITEAIQKLLDQRGTPGLEIRPEAKLAEDLDFDSLELAELSAELEERLGRDPYTEGIVPETVGELVGYYGE
jgi:acyl carrier protein